MADRKSASAAAPFRVQTERHAWRTSSASKYPVREDALAALPRKDRTRQRGDEQNADNESADDNEGLQPVYEIQVFGDPRRERRQIVEHEALEDHQKCERHYRDERVLNERLQPRPEEP